MKKIPLVILALLTLLAPSKASAAVEWVIPYSIPAPSGGSTLTKFAPLPNSQKWHFYIRCGNIEQSSWLDELVVSETELAGVSWKNASDVSSCPSIGIGSLWVEQLTGSGLDSTKNYYVKLNFTMAIAGYEDADVTRYSTSGPFIVSTGNLPRTVNWGAWSPVGASSTHAFAPIDMTTEYLGYSQDLVYDSGSGVNMYPGHHVYNVILFGYLSTSSGANPDVPTSLLIGDPRPNQVRASNMIMFNKPAGDPRYQSTGYRMWLGKGSVQFSNVVDEQEAIVNAINDGATTAHTDANRLNTSIQTGNNLQIQNNTILTNLKNQEQANHEEIMDDDTTQGQTEISNFFNDFDDGSDPTLASIVTKPISFAQTMLTSACTPLVLPLPFVNENLELPCGRAYISNFAAPILALWDIISVGLIAYHIGTDIFVKVHEMKNPDNDGNVRPLEL